MRAPHPFKRRVILPALSWLLAGLLRAEVPPYDDIQPARHWDQLADQSAKAIKNDY